MGETLKETVDVLKVENQRMVNEKSADSKRFETMMEQNLKRHRSRYDGLNETTKFLKNELEKQANILAELDHYKQTVLDLKKKIAILEGSTKNIKIQPKTLESVILIETVDIRTSEPESAIRVTRNNHRVT